MKWKFSDEIQKIYTIPSSPNTIVIENNSGVRTPYKLNESGSYAPLSEIYAKTLDQIAGEGSQRTDSVRQDQQKELENILNKIKSRTAKKN